MLSAVAELRSVLEREQVPIRLEPGAEVHICPDLIERIRDGRAPTLADNGKTLLFELSLSQYPVGLERLVFDLKLAGIEVLFAHPERIRYFQDDPARYEEVVRLGGYGQITTGSVLGVFGSEVQSFSEQLLNKGLVHVVATDAHNIRGRPPRMKEAVDVIAGHVGRERAECMALEAPRALLEGSPPELPPVEAPPRRSFLSRWFGRS